VIHPLSDALLHPTRALSPTQNRHLSTQQPARHGQQTDAGPDTNEMSCDELI
jgi:hypothetical protein